MGTEVLSVWGEEEGAGGQQEENVFPEHLGYSEGPLDLATSGSSAALTRTLVVSEGVNE